METANLKLQRRPHLLKKFANTWVVGLMLCLTSASGILLMHASKTDGEFQYNFSTVVLLAEGLKLVISGALLLREFNVSSSRIKITKKWRVSALYLVPGVIYALQNNVQFLIVKHVEPMTYELFRNFNIILTACASHLFLKRRLSTVQCVSLILLTAGVSSSQLTCSSIGYESSVRGCFWAVMSALLSATAGVYSEVVMKNTDDCIHWQNAQLYTYGLIFNSVILLCSSSFSRAPTAHTFSTGFLFENFDLSAVSFY